MCRPQIILLKMLFGSKAIFKGQIWAMVGKIALNKKSRFDRSHTANAHYENQNRVLMLPGNKRKSILACPNASKKVHINMPPSMILAFAVKLSERKKKPPMPPFLLLLLSLPVSWAAERAGVQVSGSTMGPGFARLIFFRAPKMRIQVTSNYFKFYPLSLQPLSRIEGKREYEKNFGRLQRMQL